MSTRTTPPTPDEVRAEPAGRRLDAWVHWCRAIAVAVLLAALMTNS